MHLCMYVAAASHETRFTVIACKFSFKSISFIKRAVNSLDIYTPPSLITSPTHSIPIP